MTREIRFNAFVVNRPVHQSPGLWRHPRDRSTSYKDLDYWCDLAQTLERGGFESMFLADGIGTSDSYGGNIDASLRHGIMIPTNDPFPLVPAMARETRHLSFSITGNLSFEPPYLFARRFSTLDQLTKGRVGWNIVTGTRETGARGMGRDGLVPHDQRYDIADEFMDVVYRLWEGSWEDDAAVWNKLSGLVARPEKIHPVTVSGAHFAVDGIHLSEPSPQRTPVLFQAGSSERGRVFAARHAECVFLSGPSPRVIGGVIKDVRERAAANGRDPRSILFFPMATVIVGETEAQAQAKLEDYRRYISTEAAMVLFSGFTGIDFSKASANDPIEYMTSSQGVRSALEAFTIADPGRVWTVGEIAQHLAIGGRGPLIVGSAEQVADALEGWIEATDADGFNLAYALSPETYEDVVDLLVPELRRRGAYKKDYKDGTFREKLFGSGRRLLPADHPGAAARRPATADAAVADDTWAEAEHVP